MTSMPKQNRGDVPRKRHGAVVGQTDGLNAADNAHESHHGAERAKVGVSHAAWVRQSFRAKRGY